MSEFGNIIIYKDKNGKENIEVKIEDGTVWLNQAQLVKLYNSSKSNISEHIKHIYEEGELEEESTVRNFRTVATNGKTYDMKYYNLDMIVAIGFRVKSDIGTNFRKWANDKLKEYMIKGFVLNDEKLKNNGESPYFEELLARIRDIRSSEKVFWRKVLDIYATAIDYDPKDKVSIEFFNTVQNKMHYATHGSTAAEVIFNRVDSSKENLGLTNFKGDYPTKSETEIAKNYLTEEELNILNRMVSAYLDVAEINALDRHPMTMQDWVNELDSFLKMTRKDILKGKGTISHEKALKKAHEEYDKYMQNHLTTAEQDYLEMLNKEIEEMNK